MVSSDDPSGGRTPLGIWLPAHRTGTGSDRYTQSLADGFNRYGNRAEIAWLPLRAEYAPWSMPVPPVPDWADVVHVNSWLHSRFFAASRKPVVATSHGCVHDPALRPYKSLLQAIYHRAWIRPQEARTLRRAAVITAVSRYTAERTKAEFGVDDVSVVPNWLPPDAFEPLIRERHDGPFRLIFVGSWCRRKGIDLLSPIMRGLGDGFLLSFTGEPPKHETLPANMLPLGWASARAQVRSWLKESDAMLFPSRLEGMPLAVLEAMGVGLPVVAARTASLPEIVMDGETGLLCPADDVDAFVAAVRRLRDNRPLWTAMQVAAAKRARREFTEEVAIRAYLHIYSAIGTARLA
jgi:glycosyltransferase involved in cell wall biosynthesis